MSATTFMARMRARITRTVDAEVVPAVEYIAVDVPNNPVPTHMFDMFPPATREIIEQMAAATATHTAAREARYTVISRDTGRIVRSDIDRPAVHAYLIVYTDTNLEIVQDIGATLRAQPRTTVRTEHYVIRPFEIEDLL